jgi:pyruvate dehydrogenase E2 component (dihydrolipoamide acetyltransferase)
MDQETGTVAAWLKHEGERVQADETVLVIETSKVAIDVPAPATGTLARVTAQVGDVVPVTAVIAYILKDGETLADLPGPGSGNGAAAVSVAATPVAMRMADELGIDLARVPAAGERVTKADVERFRAAAPGPAGRVAVAATPAARRIAREKQIDLAALGGSGPRGRVQARDVLAQPESTATSSAGSDRPASILAVSGLRRTIADRMQASFHDAPHIALTVEVDVSALEAARTRLNAMAARQGEGKVTVTALLVRLTAWALERHPLVNASWVDGQIYQWHDVNVGVATAVPDGLIVPVIRAANRQGLREIAAALQDLTARAQDGRLTLRDVQHGTFTISNLGMFGIRQFRAILNPPESAILAVGAVVRRPVVINERDEVAVRPLMALTLSADHRVIDGVVAAHFLADVVQALEQPDIALY